MSSKYEVEIQDGWKIQNVCSWSFTDLALVSSITLLHFSTDHAFQFLITFCTGWFIVWGCRNVKWNETKSIT